MDMPKPGDEHRRLETLAGSWRGEEKLYPSPWDPQGGTATGRIEARLGIDGFFLISDYVEVRDGQVCYRGHGVYGWDDKQKCYTMHWFDSMGGGGHALPARGRWEKDTLTFQHQAPLGHARYTYTMLEDGRYAFKIEHSKDGNAWTLFMEAEYARD